MGSAAEGLAGLAGTLVASGWMGGSDMVTYGEGCGLDRWRRLEERKRAREVNATLQRRRQRL